MESDGRLTKGMLFANFARKGDSIPPSYSLKSPTAYRSGVSNSNYLGVPVRIVMSWESHHRVRVLTEREIFLYIFILFPFST